MGLDCYILVLHRRHPSLPTSQSQTAHSRASVADQRIFPLQLTHPWVAPRRQNPAIAQSDKPSDIATLCTVPWVLGQSISTSRAWAHVPAATQTKIRCLLGIQLHLGFDRAAVSKNEHQPSNPDTLTLQSRFVQPCGPVFCPRWESSCPASCNQQDRFPELLEQRAQTATAANRLGKHVAGCWWVEPAFRLGAANNLRVFLA